MIVLFAIVNLLFCLKSKGSVSSDRQKSERFAL